MRQVPCEVQVSKSGRSGSGFIGAILDQPFLKGKSAVLRGLLRAIFENKWKSGKGKDQIAAFRAIPQPFAGKIRTRKDARI
jgi:hypothetical protein